MPGPSRSQAGPLPRTRFSSPTCTFTCSSRPARTPASLKPLASKMADGKATLVAWSLVGDLLWMRPTARGLKQTGVPEAGETLAWFQHDLARIKAYIAEQNLKIVRTPADVELALKGDPHVVLSVEGASFVDDDLSQVRHRLRSGHPAHSARALHQEPDRRFPDRAARAQWAVRFRQEGRGGMQPAGNSDRSRALHRRGRIASAGHFQGADGLVAQLRDEGLEGRIGRCRHGRRGN